MIDLSIEKRGEIMEMCNQPKYYAHRIQTREHLEQMLWIFADIYGYNINVVTTPTGGYINFIKGNISDGMSYKNGELLEAIYQAMVYICSKPEHTKVVNIAHYRR